MAWTNQSTPPAHSSTLVSELRTSSLGPKQYYELYMAVFDALRYLSVHLRENHPVNHLADLYELVQYAGNIVPRLYLMITVGTAYMSIPDAPVKELMKDMMDMSRGVQHPIRGLFLRYYLSETTSPLGNLSDSINFILTNFVEMNKLWVRLQHQGHSREREQRTRERKELQLLVGSNIVRLSQLVDLETYKSGILAPCLSRSCNEYLLEVITQVFPDDFHLHTLDQFLGAVSRLNPHVNVKAIVIGLMDRLSDYAERESKDETEGDRAKLEEEALAALLEKTSLKNEGRGASSAPGGHPDANDEPGQAADLSLNGRERSPRGRGPPAPGGADPSIADTDATAVNGEGVAPEKGIPENVQLYEIFFSQVKNLVEAQHLPIQDTIALLCSLTNLALNIYPNAWTSSTRFSTTQPSRSGRTQTTPICTRPSPAQPFSPAPGTPQPIPFHLHRPLPPHLRPPLPVPVVSDAPCRRRRGGPHPSPGPNSHLDPNQLENVLEVLKVLIKEGSQASSNYPGVAQRRAVETDETMEEQGWLARIVHLVDGEDNDTQFRLLQMTRKAYSEGNERIRTTTPPLITACMKLARRFKAREHYEDNWETQSNALFKFMHSALSTLYTRVNGAGAAELALRLFCASGQTADMAGFEEVAYEFFAQAFTVYEEAISDSKAQFQAVCVIATALHQTRNFGKENYDTLITKCAQHGSKLLRKPDQCRAVYLASHLWWATPMAVNGETDETGHTLRRRVQILKLTNSQLYRDGKRVLECLQRALRVADSCMETATSIELFVEILDRYVYYFDQQNAAVTTKYLNGLIELIHSNLAGNQQDSASVENSKRHFYHILESIKGRQYEGVVLYPK
ncbi:hypothetical protein ColKHC_01420 [Colletotrichum higginsianum]|nr:hypothetical protein ColKHC_01420 [Colletotrichum higginsianum]